MHRESYEDSVKNPSDARHLTRHPPINWIVTAPGEDFIVAGATITRRLVADVLKNLVVDGGS